MAKIVNFDELKRPDENKFILGGDEYLCPGNIPVESMLELDALGQRMAANQHDSDAFRDMLSCLWKIIAPLNKQRTFDEFKGSINIEMLPLLMDFIVNGDKNMNKTDAGEGVDGEQKNDSGVQRLDE